MSVRRDGERTTYELNQPSRPRPNVSNKKNSRSNLFRSRRRLSHSLREGGSLTPPPEAWSRPAISGTARAPDRVHLVAAPVRRTEGGSGSLPDSAAGEVIDRLSVLVRPLPGRGCRVSYRVTIGADVHEAREVPVDDAGIARPEIAHEALLDAEEISVEWQFEGQRIVRTWQRKG